MRTRLRRGVSWGLGVVLTAGLLGTAQPSASGGERAAAAAAEPAPAAGEAASEVEALAEAERTGEPVEVLSLRGETSEVFATPEGTFEAVEYLRPVRTRVNGQWEEVNTDLLVREDGTVAPVTATVELAFSGGGEDAPMASLTRDGRVLEFHWPGALPVPTLHGALAVYEDVLPDVDLRMGAQVDGFTQLLVVHSPEAAASPELAEVTLGLEAQGVEVETTSDGGLAAIDEGAGSPVFEAPAPVMWDSSAGTPEGTAVREAATEEVGAGESGRQARVGLEVTGDSLVLTPDADILRDEETEFPVYIDPQVYTPRASAWTMVSRYWHDSPQWLFNGEDDAGMGYCDWTRCQPEDRKRLFYRMPVSRFAGTNVIEAQFQVPNVHSASCTATRVELYQTWSISSGTTWDSQDGNGFWAEHLDTRSFAYGHQNCAAKDAEFDVTAAVREAADTRRSTLTLGLRAASETDPLSWKRFSDRAHLRVEYNRRPPQIRTSQLVMQYGGTCPSPDDPAHVKTRGSISALHVTDPDGDRVAVEFGARWDTGDGQGDIIRWAPNPTGFKASGSTFTVSLPTNLPTDRRIEWFARTFDGVSYSPWSSNGSAHRCAFVYDTSTPAAPTITSPQYPEADPSDPEDPWRDGIGKYGSFTFDSAASDVTGYAVHVNASRTGNRWVQTSGGAPRTLQLLPETPGINTITAQALDEAGNWSEVRTYLFVVRAGEPERMVWGMEDEPGADALTGEGEPWEAALTTGAAPGADGVVGGALELDGQGGHASVVTPVLDTSKSFSVSLWARLPEGGLSGPGTAVSQAGWNADGFALTVDPQTGWSFSRDASDVAGAAAVRARQGHVPELGEWTNVTGVFDNVNQQLRLYVDGSLAASTGFTGAWEARGVTTLGATGDGSYFTGRLDEVQLYDYWLRPEQVTQLVERQPITETSRPAKAVWSLDEPDDVTSVAGRSQETRAAITGEVTLGGEGADGAAASFDGASGYAATSQPVLDTHQSFAVSLWAWLPAEKENRFMVAATQGGAERRGFSLYHRPDGGGWTFLRATSDAADAANVEVNQNPCSAATPNCPAAGLGTWAHVVGVYDMDAGTISLYVNGELADSTAFSHRWDATGSLMLGASEAEGQVINRLDGKLDDVRLFDRVVTASEVRQLYEQRPLVGSRWQFDDAGAGTTPDSSSAGNPLGLQGGAALGPGAVDSGSLLLDGVDDHAATTTVPVDTTASFTVAGWARAAAVPEGGATAFSAGGEHHSAVSVRFVPDPEEEGWGTWQLVMPDADTSEASVTRVDNALFYDVREWNHLTVVYDGFRREAELYVNGVLAETSCLEGEDDSCGSSSSAENVLTFEADDSLQVGRTRAGGAWGEYWPGAIDDLWTFEGTLAPSQVTLLATGISGLPTRVPVTR
ncbi:LamG-like jellyroll fold domain-containing protein [Streptomyces sp. SBT349]|uniref:LamG-like jellyroll fold domain-containing protein n=1 Tax=Streptomyces sp. SBT349 TaxID=1580539 RepID=UPI00099DF340|nr:LamG-like jellyroll fold domain-containing protein [Streptomyces sp. SBT349]